MLLYILMIVVCVVMTLRAFLIVVGMYKDPILASFEHYGDERVFSPTLTLLIWTGFSVYLFTFLILEPGLVLFTGALALVAGFSFRESIARFVKRRQQLSRSLPVWYAQLVERTDRHERRRIAYLWLRLPARTRLLYNAHNGLFHHWMEQVLLTIS